LIHTLQEAAVDKPTLPVESAVVLPAALAEALLAELPSVDPVRLLPSPRRLSYYRHRFETDSTLTRAGSGSGQAGATGSAGGSVGGSGAFFPSPSSLGDKHSSSLNQQALLPVPSVEAAASLLDSAETVALQLASVVEVSFSSPLSTLHPLLEDETY
jgi:hypothetical protein